MMNNNHQFHYADDSVNTPLYLLLGCIVSIVLCAISYTNMTAMPYNPQSKMFVTWILCTYIFGLAACVLALMATVFSIYQPEH